MCSAVCSSCCRYSSPKAKFVTASLGQTVQGDKNGGGLILDAMENVADATKYPEFKGNVAAVCVFLSLTRPPSVLSPTLPASIRNLTRPPSRALYASRNVGRRCAAVRKPALYNG